MATVAELQTDLAAVQVAITQAEQAQQMGFGDKQKTNPSLRSLYEERRRLRDEIASMQGGNPSTHVSYGRARRFT